MNQYRTVTWIDAWNYTSIYMYMCSCNVIATCTSRHKAKLFFDKAIFTCGGIPRPFLECFEGNSLCCSTPILLLSSYSYIHVLPIHSEGGNPTARCHGHEQQCLLWCNYVYIYIYMHHIKFLFNKVTIYGNGRARLIDISIRPNSWN